MSCNSKYTEFEICMREKNEIVTHEEQKMCANDSDCASQKCIMADCNAFHKILPKQGEVCNKIGKCSIHVNTGKNTCRRNEMHFNTQLNTQVDIQSDRFSTNVF